MKINALNQRTDLGNHAKLKETYGQFEKLLLELRKRDLPEALAISINKDIDEINTTGFSETDFLKVIKKKLTGIIKLLEKEVKWVPKNYYRNLWMTLGMSVFGIPLGVAFGASLGSMAYLGIGLPIGLAIGIAVGSGMDKKAFEEGRQLDVEIKS
jgi:hypothetical protein